MGTLSGIENPSKIDVSTKNSFKTCLLYLQLHQYVIRLKELF